MNAIWAGEPAGLREPGGHLKMSTSIWAGEPAGLREPQGIQNINAHTGWGARGAPGAPGAHHVILPPLVGPRSGYLSFGGSPPGGVGGPLGRIPPHVMVGLPVPFFRSSRFKEG